MVCLATKPRAYQEIGPMNESTASGSWTAPHGANESLILAAEPAEQILGMNGLRKDLEFVPLGAGFLE